MSLIKVFFKLLIVLVIQVFVFISTNMTIVVFSVHMKTQLDIIEQTHLTKLTIRMR